MHRARPARDGTVSTVSTVAVDAGAVVGARASIDGAAHEPTLFRVDEAVLVADLARGLAHTAVRALPLALALQLREHLAVLEGAPDASAVRMEGAPAHATAVDERSGALTTHTAQAHVARRVGYLFEECTCREVHAAHAAGTHAAAAAAAAEPRNVCENREEVVVLAAFAWHAHLSLDAIALGGRSALPHLLARSHGRLVLLRGAPLPVARGRILARGEWNILLRLFVVRTVELVSLVLRARRRQRAFSGIDGL